MSKLVKFLAVVLLFASVTVFAPSSADARWGGGWHGGGWGWGPGWAGPRCGWVPVRTWRSGHWWFGRAWRCW
jgi:hypothetical protein